MVAAAEDVNFSRTGISDGEDIVAGGLTLTALATPGHTPGHLSYVLREGKPTAVFTGGSMLFGAVGRTDLISPELAETLTRAQYNSVGSPPSFSLARKCIHAPPTRSSVDSSRVVGRTNCCAIVGVDGDAGSVGTEQIV